MRVSFSPNLHLKSNELSAQYVFYQMGVNASSGMLLFVVRELMQLKSSLFGSPMGIRWHICKIVFPQKRAGLSDLTALSVHVDDIRAEKAEAAPAVLEHVLKSTRDPICRVDITTCDLNLSNKPTSVHA